MSNKEDFKDVTHRSLHGAWGDYDASRLYRIPLILKNTWIFPKENHIATCQSACT